MFLGCQDLGPSALLKYREEIIQGRASSSWAADQLCTRSITWDLVKLNIPALQV
jgi:hypothetical protein